jgi:hypothetical protein
MTLFQIHGALPFCGLFIIIIIIYFYSLVEHSARVKIRYLVLFAAKAFISAQLFFSGINSYQKVVSSDPSGFSSLWFL